MIDKALYVIIFMYTISFGILGMQYVLGDVYNITIKNFEGVPIKPSLLNIIDTNNLNTVTTKISNATKAENKTLDAVINAFQIGFNVGKDLLLLMTGTYVFNILYLLGVPVVVIAGMVVVYVIIVGRALIAYIRGV